MIQENTIVTSSPPTKGSPANGDTGSSQEQNAEIGDAIRERGVLPLHDPRESAGAAVEAGLSERADRASAKANLGYNPWRGVTADTMKFFDVKSNDELIIYPWGPNAQQMRRKDTKDFWWEGQAKDSQGLFGMDRFVSGHNFVVTITEGALDAMSLWQALGGKYAVVSVKSSSSALADCTREFDWLNGYDKIKLAFDNDKPGQDAAQQVARLFDVNKVYWVKS